MRCREVGVGDALTYERRPRVVTGVGAEEAHVRTDPVQPHERLSDAGVVDVALDVDGEVVVAERLLGRARLDAREVDAAHGELREDLEQCARVVLAHEQEQRGLVGARRSGEYAGPRHQHEARPRLVVVADVVDEHLEAVDVGGEPRRDRGVIGPLGDTGSAGGVGGFRDDLGVGKVGRDPLTTLRVRHGVRRHATYRRHRRTRLDHEREAHRDDDLVDDDQLVTSGELVDGAGHRTLDGVLDRHQAGVDRARADGLDDGRRGRVGEQVGALAHRHREQRGLGERATRAEEGDRGHEDPPRSA